MADSSYESSVGSPPPSTTEARTNRDSIKKGFSDFRKFAGTNFTRAKQYVTEKAGKADTLTGYDDSFEELCHKMEQIKIITEKMIAQIESVVQPNPNIRLEDWARTKLDRPKPTRPNPHYNLSADLAAAAEAFGQDTDHGVYLRYCSQVEAKIAESERRFQEKGELEVLTPLKAFLEVDIKSIMRERKTLNIYRLDLDACRTSHKKSQGDAKVSSTEMALRDAQAEYDQQLAKVRVALQKVVDTHVKNKGYLYSFMTAQRALHQECQAHLDEDRSGSPQLMAGGVDEASSFSVGGLELSREDSRQARMLYDYEATEKDELTLCSGDVLKVTPIPEDTEYLMAEYNGKLGKVPSTYLEYH